MTQKRTRENLNRLPREVEATLPSWVKCTYPISAETLEEVRSTVLVWLANVSNYVQETNRFENIDGIQTSSYVTSIGTPGTTGAWVFFVVSQNPSIIKYVCANHGSSMGNYIDFTD